MNKRQKISLGILFILIVLFLVTKMRNNVEKRVIFFKADSTDVAAIEISNIKDTIRITKTLNAWRFAAPKEFPVSERQIKSFFEKALPAKASLLPISESEESFDTYHVSNSLGSWLKLYDKDDQILDVVILGKSSFPNTTPVRRPNENKVYQLEENLSYLITPKEELWREKTILQIEENNIKKISVIYTNNAYELTSTDSVWLYTDSKSSLNVDQYNEVLSSMLSALSKITVSNFINDNYLEYEQKLLSPDLEIGIELYNGSSSHMRIALDKNSKYVLQLNGNTKYLYSIYKNWIDKFTKEAMDFK
ncbi:MAG: DUF4340 domain-containing protein [Candidatus Cloacimonetes bacterium]|nr:DUF4340 domain-containing protein [Candidatus Cloacimonadota bacterium]